MQFNFKSIVSEDNDTNRVQANIDNLVTQMNKTITGGNIVTANVLTTDTKFMHGLGRPVIGWFVIDKNVATDVWQSTTTNEIPRLQIILKANVAAKVKIYFF